MDMIISGHHLEVTPALREYVKSKLNRVIRHFDQMIDATVILTVDNSREKDRRQRAEVTIRVKGRDIYVESIGSDLYAAIDVLVDKLDRQVLRYKARIQNHQHNTLKH